MAPPAREVLTPREEEVLAQFAQGRRPREVAARLAVSVYTIRTHAQNILRKLGVHSKLAAVAYAWRTGLVSR